MNFEITLFEQTTLSRCEQDGNSFFLEIQELARNEGKIRLLNAYKNYHLQVDSK